MRTPVSLRTRVSAGTQRGSRGGYPIGRRSREGLLEAVLRVVARDGVSAVTHRGVNAEAGVAHGLTTYYFSTKHEMLRAAYEHWISKTLEHTGALAAALEEGVVDGNRLGAVVEALVDVTIDELESGHAAAGFAFAREPSLAEAFGRWEKRILSLLERESVELGSSDPRQDARIVLSVVRGLQLEHVSGAGRRPSRAALRATLSRVVESLTVFDQAGTQR